MSFFDQIFPGLFSKEHNKGQLLHELLNRSDSFKRDYSLWIREEKNFILSKIKRSIEQKKAKMATTDINVHLLNGSHSNGLAIAFDGLISSKKEFCFLMEYFKDCVTEKKYKTANADVKILEKEKFLETTERYYLKPIITGEDAPRRQRYGNVIIEHILQNDKSAYLKLMANTYTDSNYQPPLDFDDLCEYIFDK